MTQHTYTHTHHNESQNTKLPVSNSKLNEAQIKTFADIQSNDLYSPIV